MREIEKRLRALEAVGKRMNDAILTVTLRDGTQKKMLWCDAMRAENITNVEGCSGLADLVRVFLC